MVYSRLQRSLNFHISTMGHAELHAKQADWLFELLLGTKKHVTSIQVQQKQFIECVLAFCYSNITFFLK